MKVLARRRLDDSPQDMVTRQLRYTDGAYYPVKAGALDPNAGYAVATVGGSMWRTDGGDFPYHDGIGSLSVVGLYGGGLTSIRGIFISELDSTLYVSNQNTGKTGILTAAQWRATTTTAALMNCNDGSTDFTGPNTGGAGTSKWTFWRNWSIAEVTADNPLGDLPVGTIIFGLYTEEATAQATFKYAFIYCFYNGVLNADPTSMLPSTHPDLGADPFATYNTANLYTGAGMASGVGFRHIHQVKIANNWLWVTAGDGNTLNIAPFNLSTTASARRMFRMQPGGAPVPIGGKDTGYTAMIELEDGTILCGSDRDTGINHFDKYDRDTGDLVSRVEVPGFGCPVWDFARQGSIVFAVTMKSYFTGSTVNAIEQPGRWTADWCKSSGKVFISEDNGETWRAWIDSTGYGAASGYIKFQDFTHHTIFTDGRQRIPDGWDRVYIATSNPPILLAPIPGRST